MTKSPQKQNLFISSADEVAQVPRPKLRDFIQRKYLLPDIGLAVSAVLSILVPWCLVQVIDQGITNHDYQVLGSWVLAAALCQGASGLMKFISTCTISKYALEIEKKRISHLYRHIMQADLRALPEMPQGSAMGQIMSTSRCERLFFETLHQQGIPLAVTAVGTCLALLALSPMLAVCSLGILPVAAILWFWMKRRIRPAARQDYENQEALYQFLNDTFRAIIPIRALHQTDKFTDQLDEIATSNQTSSYQLLLKLAIQGPFFDVLQAFVLIAVFGLGGYWVINGSLSIGALLGFQLYLTRLFSLLRGGTSIFGTWQHFLEGRVRAATIESLPSAPAPAFLKTEPSEVLRLDNISFSFDTHEVWHRKSLIIHQGERHAVLLPSGSGKTTLARCILGLYPISEGSISLPGASSRSIGFVSQENILFDGTIRENISLMSTSIDDAHYDRLVQICAIEELVARFKDESIGEQGARLSGGEQRRVMLARALASTPDLLIIDQMASELEPELCRTIFDRIRENMPQMGILYLGHRMPEWGD